MQTDITCTNSFQKLTLESWYTNLQKHLLTDVNNYWHITNNFIDKWTSNRPADNRQIKTDQKLRTTDNSLSMDQISNTN